MTLKQSQKIRQLSVLLLLLIVTFVSWNVTAYAEKIPYEYDFISTDTTKKFNGFTGVKDLVITLDKPIPATTVTGTTAEDIKNKLAGITDPTKTYITLFQGNVEKKGLLDLANMKVEAQKITIPFKNLQYVKYTSSPTEAPNFDYKVVISKEAQILTAQTKELEFPFKVYEVLPGFQSIFIGGTDYKATETAIDTNIFKYTAPRDVMVHVPTAYITNIKTIHRYDGLEFGETVEPRMTNVDVLTSSHPIRMKAWMGAKGSTYIEASIKSRDLDVRNDLDGGYGFSMGQAGIEALECNANTLPCEDIKEDDKDFHLVAYDSYGKRLIQRSFKVKVNNKVDDFIIEDYIIEPDTIFGTTVSLYTLMEDPELVARILEYMPASDFEKLGITYKLNSTQTVETEEQLLLALDNADITTILLANDIALTNDIIVPRKVTIDGNNKTITGNVLLKAPTAEPSINVKLKNLNITGKLTIDVGATGEAVLDSVTTADTEILSGGVNSIYLFNFTSSNPVAINNTTSPVRIVNTGKMPAFKLMSNSEVTIEGLNKTDTLLLDVQSTDGKLTVKNSEGGAVVLKDNTITAGNKLTLKVQDTVSPPTGMDGSLVVDYLPSNSEDGKTVIEKEYTEKPSKPLVEWNNGVDLDINTLSLPEGITLFVENPNVFGEGYTVSLEGVKLKIAGTTTITEPVTKRVLLRGIANNTIYRITVEVTIALPE